MPRLELNAEMREMFAKYLSEQGIAPTAPGTTSTPGTTTTLDYVSKEAIKPEVLGVFDPGYRPDPTDAWLYKGPPVVSDALTWDHRLDRLYAVVKDEAVAGALQETYNRGVATDWWLYQVPEADKTEMRKGANNGRLYREAFRKRFGISAAEAQNMLATTTYGLPQVQAKQSIMDFFNRRYKLVRMTGVSDDPKILALVWNGILPPLRNGFAAPAATETADGFLERLKQLEDTWRLTAEQQQLIEADVLSNHAQWLPSYEAPMRQNTTPVPPTNRNAQPITTTSRATTTTNYQSPTSFPTFNPRPYRPYQPPPRVQGNFGEMELVWVPVESYAGDVMEEQEMEEPEGYVGEVGYEDSYTMEEPLDTDTFFASYYPGYGNTHHPTVSSPNVPLPVLVDFSEDPITTPYPMPEPLDLTSLLPSFLGFPLSSSSYPSIDLQEIKQDSAIKLLSPPPVTTQSSDILNPLQCTQCPFIAPSKRQLRRHLQAHYASTPLPAQFAELGPALLQATPRYVVSKALPTTGLGTEFKQYTFAKLPMALNDELLLRTFLACLDGGCGISLIDDVFLQGFPTIPRLHRAEPLHVKGIGDAWHQSSQFISVTLYLPLAKRIGGETNRIAVLQRDLHIVPTLGCKVLIGNDIAVPEGFVVDFGNQTLKVASCDNLSIPLSIAKQAIPATLLMVAAERLTIPPFTTAAVPISTRALLPHTPYEFVPYTSHTPKTLRQFGAMQRCWIYATNEVITIANLSDKPLLVPKHAQLGTCFPVDFEQLQTYTLDPDNPLHAHLADQALVPDEDYSAYAYWTSVAAHKGEAYISELWQRAGTSYLNEVFASTADKNTPPAPPSIPAGSFDEKQFNPKLTPDQRAQIDAILRDHSSIFNPDSGFVDEPEEDWMRIELKPEHELKSRGTFRVPDRDKLAIDAWHDKMQAAGQLSWSRGGGSAAGWSAFVVWDNRKCRIHALWVVNR
ncbi:hypothetical protein BJ508DRAFT_336129 [Ascobolus immersus RN42]|uniref:C2H2-type domain-containing protein n=1 Tax=Ascobolus immersus RN42 TaxID=1160509 RepID=A0A3N4HH00_ASCIM|nr:hypothetical protein BJ508DRAFT_336129 [Ascobolus immersus RN42]